jgi:hypothetical protein
MKKPLATAFMYALLSSVAIGQPYYGPYNQQYTINQNQQMGSTNWYSSALGLGVAQAGVTLIGGLVNAMSRPDPVIYTQPQQTPVYVNNRPIAGQAGTQSIPNNGNCSMQTLYDQQGIPKYVKICE